MRNWVQTVCIVLCALLCLFLIRHMVLYTNIPMHTPHTPVQRAGQVETAEQTDAIEVSLDSGALTTLLTRQLPLDFPLQEIQIQITEQDNLLCMAQIEPENLPLPRAAHVLLPKSCSLYALISVGYADQKIVLHPVSLKIGGLKLPHALLTPIAEELGTAITDGIRAQGIQICALRMQEQRMHIGMTAMGKKTEQTKLSALFA